MDAASHTQAPTRTNRLRPGDRLLLRSLSSRRGSLAVLVTALLLETAVDLALPLALAHAMDTVLSGGQVATAVALLSIILALAATSEAAIRFADPCCTADGVAELRRRAVRHWLSAGAGLSRPLPVGDVVTRIVGNSTQISGTALVLARIATSGTAALGALVALGLIDLWLPLALAVTLPVAVMMVRASMRNTSDLAGEYQQVQSTIVNRLLDALHGARTIRAYGTVALETERVLTPLPRLNHLGTRMWRVLATVSWQSALLGPFVYLLMLSVAGFGVAAHQVTPGEMAAVGLYSAMVLGVFEQAQLLARLARARAATGRIADLLHYPALRSGRRELPPGTGHLVIRDVTLDLDGRRVLDGIDLCLPAGTSLALVGRSGCGKSVLAAVAGGLAVPDSGTVSIDDVPLDLLSHDALRSAVSYAFERPVLLGDTVADTIDLAPTATSRARVTAAARAARADAFIQRLPAGYDNPISETPLSGGELQRIGLARAFVRQARLLILDDATSSLDTATEHEIQQALDDAAGGHTRLLIARRPATAARADRVAWLHHGRIRAVATHRELWADPAYRAVFAHEGLGAVEPEQPEQPEQPDTSKEHEVASS